MEPKYKRILLKVSGEALAGDNKTGLNDVTIGAITDKIKECVELGVQIAIVVGGGNFWRGRTGENMDRTRAAHMGMLATVINACNRHQCSCTSGRTAPKRGRHPRADRHRNEADCRAIHKRQSGASS